MFHFFEIFYGHRYSVSHNIAAGMIFFSLNFKSDGVQNLLDRTSEDSLGYTGGNDKDCLFLRPLYDSVLEDPLENKLK